MHDLLSLYVQQLVGRSPSLVICLIGLLVAIGQLKRHPRPALFVLLGMVLLLISSLLLPLAQLYLIHFHDEVFVALPLGTIMTGFSLIWSVLNAVALGLLVAAAFADRLPFAPRRFMEDDDYPPIAGR